MSPTYIAIVFTTAIAVRGAYVMANYLYLGIDGLMGPDSYAFLKAAHYLAEGGSYMQIAITDSPGIGLDLMPVPFLIMSWMLQTGAPPNPLGFVLFQIPVDAATCILLGLLAERLRSGTFLLAGLIAALNPTQVVMSGLYYTDTLFLLFVTAGLLSTVSWLEKPNAARAGSAGLAWALALTTRPFVQHWLMLAPVILLPLAVWRNRSRWLRAVAGIAAILVICVAATSPILMRNHDTFGAAKLHAQTGAHLLFWAAPLVREFEDGVPVGQSEVEWRKELLATSAYQTARNPFEESDAMSALAAEKLAELGAPAVAAAWIKGATFNLITPASTISPLFSNLPRQGFFETPGDNLGDKVWNFLFNNEGFAFTAILLASALPIPVALAVAVLGFFSCVRTSPSTAIPAILLFLWAGYTLGLNGPVFSPKYRLPLEPVWVVMTAIGLMVLYDRFMPATRRGGIHQP